ncbi:SEL1-like repeat protein [Mesorhizobium sp. M0293]|uniref:tetratricopeptide repeat protein n=1 Tax=Mesorhizobium sp. M0293 TaxID=2956930 RepID=UPI0033393CD5
MAQAQRNLGISYHDGRGVPQDHAEAAKWLRLAADQGWADAQYDLGVIIPKVRACRRTMPRL